MIYSLTIMSKQILILFVFNKILESKTNYNNDNLLSVINKSTFLIQLHYKSLKMKH